MTQRIALAALVSAALLAGCDQGTPSSSPTGSTSGSTTGTVPAKPDNTRVNERDRNTGTLTPPDQAQGTDTDRRITADVRKAITDDSAMSMNARNVKIVTLNGVVTLRGPVDTQAEKDAIEAKAKGVAGVTSVDNQLEVKQP